MKIEELCYKPIYFVDSQNNETLVFITESNTLVRSNINELGEAADTNLITVKMLNIDESLEQQAPSFFDFTCRSEEELIGSFRDVDDPELYKEKILECFHCIISKSFEVTDEAIILNSATTAFSSYIGTDFGKQEKKSVFQIDEIANVYYTGEWQDNEDFVKRVENYVIDLYREPLTTDIVEKTTEIANNIQKFIFNNSPISITITKIIVMEENIKAILNKLKERND